MAYLSVLEKRFFSVADHQVEITRISHTHIHDDYIRYNGFLE